MFVIGVLPELCQLLSCCFYLNCLFFINVGIGGVSKVYSGSVKFSWGWGLVGACLGLSSPFDNLS